MTLKLREVKGRYVGNLPFSWKCNLDFNITLVNKQRTLNRNMKVFKQHTLTNYSSNYICMYFEAALIVLSAKFVDSKVNRGDRYFPTVSITRAKGAITLTGLICIYKMLEKAHFWMFSRNFFILLNIICKIWHLYWIKVCIVYRNR